MAGTRVLRVLRSLHALSLSVLRNLIVCVLLQWVDGVFFLSTSAVCTVKRQPSATTKPNTDLSLTNSGSEMYEYVWAFDERIVAFGQRGVWVYNTTSTLWTCVE